MNVEQRLPLWKLEKQSMSSYLRGQIGQKESEEEIEQVSKLSKPSSSNIFLTRSYFLSLSNDVSSWGPSIHSSWDFGDISSKLPQYYNFGLYDSLLGYFNSNHEFLHLHSFHQYYWSYYSAMYLMINFPFTLKLLWLVIWTEVPIWKLLWYHPQLFICQLFSLILK